MSMVKTVLSDSQIISGTNCFVGSMWRRFTTILPLCLVSECEHFPTDNKVNPSDYQYLLSRPCTPPGTRFPLPLDERQ